MTKRKYKNKCLKLFDKAKTLGVELDFSPKQFDPKKFDELLLKHKPIHMVGVPSYWGTIINSKKMQKQDLIKNSV